MLFVGMFYLRVKTFFFLSIDLSFCAVAYILFFISFHSILILAYILFHLALFTNSCVCGM